MTFLYDLVSWPFAWVLTFLYLLFKNYGLTLIVFTILVRLCMLPLGIKQQKTSLMQVKFQPKIKEIQEKYKTNKVKMNEEMQKLYQEEGYNPLGGCLPLIIQLPIILILYNIITRPLTNICGISAAKISEIIAALEKSGVVIDKVAKGSQIQLAQLIHDNADKLKGVLPDNFLNIDFHFLGLDLSQKPSLALNALILIPILATATAFLVSFISQRYSAVQATGTMKSMMFISPLMSLYFAFIFPAGVGLYWIMSNVTSALQSYYLGKKYNPREYAEKLKQDELEKKRLEKQRIKEKRAAKFGTALPDKTGGSENNEDEKEEEQKND